MSKAGVDNLDYGIESGYDAVLRILRRGYNTQQVCDSVELATKSGLFIKTYWMTGLPGEKDINSTKQLIKKTIELGGFPRWVTPLVILPKTELFRNPDDFKISIIKNSFEDFLSYSTTRLKKTPYYPQVITHTTEFMDF